MTHPATEPHTPDNGADLDTVFALLGSAHATLDLFYMLACAGDLDSLHQNTMTAAIADVMEKIDDARTHLHSLHLETPSDVAQLA